MELEEDPAKSLNIRKCASHLGFSLGVVLMEIKQSAQVRFDGRLPALLGLADHGIVGGVLGLVVLVTLVLVAQAGRHPRPWPSPGAESPPQ